MTTHTTTKTATFATMRSTTLGVLATALSLGTAAPASSSNVENVAIRGIPALAQHEFYHDRKDKDVVSGCGPVAAAELLMWYHARGWNGLLDDYIGSSGDVVGKIKWQELTQDLGINYLDTKYGSEWEWNGLFQGWEETGKWGMTYPSKITEGIETFVEYRGYDVNVDYRTCKSGEESTVYERIKHLVNAGRPILIGFDISSENGAPVGGGIGGGGDNAGFIDHYGLITGYREDANSQRISVNVGWGSGSKNSRGDETNLFYDFTIGKGKIHLWYVKLYADEKSHNSDDIWCPADELLEMVVEGQSVSSTIGSTAQESKYDDFEILNPIIGGSSCAVISAE